MSEPTPLVPLSEGARQYAVTSFPRGRRWVDAVSDLMRRIHDDFEFDPGATTVSTSVDEVLYQRRGVCQDFAHLMLACLRGLGLPARYVSGYLLTDPPPGMPRLMGVDASHAWVAAYSPEHGWVEFDPTNNQLADQRYITLTWGADFADVVPLRGVIFGGGEQRLDVEVSVIPT
jgi:transglutaminase-like putative cysteine protease